MTRSSPVAARSSTRSIEPRSWNRPSIATGSRLAARIAADRQRAAVAEAERPFEVARHPFAAGARRSRRPRARRSRRIARSRRATRDRSPAPAARSTSRGDRASIASSSTASARSRVAAVDRQRAVALAAAVERGLHRVKQAAARQRIHALQRLEIVGRAAAGRSRRAGTDTDRRRTSAAPTANTGASPRRCAARIGRGPLGGRGEAVPLRPRFPPAHEALAHRALQALVQLQDVLRVAARAVVRLVDQRRSVDEVVLESSIASPRSAGAGQASVACEVARRGLLQLVGARHAAGHRAPDLERVERRHARPSFADLRPSDTRGRAARSAAPTASRSCSFSARRARPASRRPAPSARARLVEQQRILARLLREHPLGQRRDEDDVEASGRAAAAGWRRARGRSGAPAARPRAWPADRRARARASSSATGPTSPIGRRSARRAARVGPRAARAARARRSASSHSRPRRLRRPRRRARDDRQRERRELPQVFDLPRELIDPRRLRLGALPARCCCSSHSSTSPFSRRSQRSPLGDHARFDEQPLPFPRRASGAARRRRRRRRRGGSRLVGARRRRRRGRPARRTLRRLDAGKTSAGGAAGGDPAPGRATGIRRTAAPTDCRARRRAARETRGRPDAAAACRDRSTPARRRARARARAARRSAAARAARSPSVERHAAARLAQHAARDLDRLAPFARRRKQLDLAGRLAQRRRRRGETGTGGSRSSPPASSRPGSSTGAERTQARRAPRDRRPESSRSRRARASERRRRTRARSTFATGTSSSSSAAATRTAPLRIGGGVRRGPQKGRAIDGRRRLELLVEALEQRGEIGAAVASARSAAGVHRRRARAPPASAPAPAESRASARPARNTTARARDRRRTARAPPPPARRARSPATAARARSSGAASRAASWVRLKRYRPKVAPRARAPARARIVGRAARRRRRSAFQRRAARRGRSRRAAASRSAADGET